jgi:hypothetical protein
VKTGAAASRLEYEDALVERLAELLVADWRRREHLQTTENRDSAREAKPRSNSSRRDGRRDEPCTS